MLPSGPLVKVIVRGGADWTKMNTAAASTTTAKRSAAMVTARLRPNISMIIISRLGLVVGKPSAAAWAGKSVESLSLLIGLQRRLAGRVEQGEKAWVIRALFVGVLGGSLYLEARRRGVTGRN